MGKKAGKGKMRISRAGTCNSIGFSLIELIVVLFILSLVLAIVLPTFSSFGENRLKAEAREMASILRYMNDNAVSRKETFFLKFDLGKNEVAWSEPEGHKTRVFDDLTGVEIQSKGLVSTGELTLFFEPLGAPENLIVYMERGDSHMTVTLNHLSGRVKIEAKDEG
jgi:general secretion pathway protein H